MSRILLRLVVLALGGGLVLHRLMTGRAEPLTYYVMFSFSLVLLMRLGGPTWFYGKRRDGSIAWWGRVLMGPFYVFRHLLWWFTRWTSNEPPINRLFGDVWVGRRPAVGDIPGGVASVVDLTHEFAVNPQTIAGRRYIWCPIPEGGIPRDPDGFVVSVRRLAESDDGMLIHCADGHGRAGLMASALLLASGRCGDADQAMRQFTAVRQRGYLSWPQRRFLRRIADQLTPQTDAAGPSRSDTSTTDVSTTDTSTTGVSTIDCAATHSAATHSAACDRRQWSVGVAAGMGLGWSARTSMGDDVSVDLDLASLPEVDHDSANVILKHSITPAAPDAVSAIRHPAGCLSPPSIPDGGSIKDLNAVPAKRPPMDELVRNAVSAPFIIDVSRLQPSSDLRSVRRVDLWFCLHADLQTLIDHAAKGQWTPGSPVDSAGARTTLLSADALTRRGIVLPATGDAIHRYQHVEIDLLDRVRLRMTHRVCVTRSADSVVIATCLDRGLNEDPEFPNRYQTIDSRRSDDLGTPQIYRGWNQYLKLTRLTNSNGLMVCELHLWMQQPDDWFGGRDLLKSKIRLGAQKMVRRLRSEIKVAT